MKFFFSIQVYILQTYISGGDAFVSLKPQRTSSPVLTSGSSSSSLSNSNDEANEMLNGGALVSTLARYDKAWNDQQNDPRSGKKSRWTKVILDKEEENIMDSMNMDGTVALTRTIQQQLEQEYCYLLEPPNSSIPSCLICFLGGAGLGQFPHIAYDEMLTRISNKLNAAVLAAPYSVGLNHWDLSKSTGEVLRKAQLICEDDKQYPSTIPTYMLSHSLGCKLSTLYMAATDRDYDGVGFISYNNFGFSETIRLVREFASQLRTGSGMGGMDGGFGANDAMFSQFFSFAETAVGALGVDFTPNSSELKQVLERKYATQSNASKTRLFVMDEDSLDTSSDVLETVGGNVVSVSKLTGTHLSPVFVKLDVNDVLGDVTKEQPELGDILNEDTLGGYKSASFGDEKDLDVLVQEVVDFVMGKPPSSPSSSFTDEPSLLSPKE